MKKMQIIIHEDGTFDVDLQDGFSGKTCVEKANIIAVALGGELDSSDKKESYYMEDPMDDVKVLINK